MGTLNSSMLGLMVSVGHRTRLFDVMAGLDWVTSAELAEIAGLNERYVREWLGSMATGHIVEVDGSDDVERFLLPKAHAVVLGRDGESMATVFQWIGVLAEAETGVVDAFTHGGGVPYEAYSRFHEVMAEESNLSVVSGLHEHILPLAPGLAAQLDAGIDVLDIGCGSGLAMCELACRFPRSRFTGYDLCPDAVAAARQNAEERGLTNVTFDVRDVTTLGASDAFDVVTAFDVIHDQRDPVGVLQAVNRALRPGATFLVQDLRCHSRISKNVGHPLCPMLYTISALHCMTVSLAQNGAGLGAAWGEELAVSMLEDAGFEDLAVNTLPHDIQNNWYVMRKPAA
jgi:2-polyprenyl-3-methyl-5-hydroxy-6-metoxy-1,4-benzoquinol methylase